jgi:DNA-binding beta-propeller fold protein YncE
MPPVLDPCNVYAADAPGMFTGPAQTARPLIYVPNSRSNTVTEIDPLTYQIVRQFHVPREPQHVVPSYDLSTLWVTSDLGNALTPIDPATGAPGRPVRVRAPYNLYFTPDGHFAIVVAEGIDRLDFRDPHTLALRHSLRVHCRGIDHMDFSANGRYLIASCEFSHQLLKVDVARQRIVGRLRLPRRGARPQDVKLAPDGSVFYVADMLGGVWEIDGTHFKVLGFLRTGAGAHGLYVSRDATKLYVTDRSAGSISVVDLASRRVVATWNLPPEHRRRGGKRPASPDMGNVSADGSVLWLSGRYAHDVYAIDTVTGNLLARIVVGGGPHGLCVWPQPGRYSTGHTGVMR